VAATPYTLECHDSLAGRIRPYSNGIVCVAADEIAARGMPAHRRSSTEGGVACDFSLHDQTRNAIVIIIIIIILVVISMRMNIDSPQFDGPILRRREYVGVVLDGDVPHNIMVGREGLQQHALVDIPQFYRPILAAAEKEQPHPAVVRVVAVVIVEIHEFQRRDDILVPFEDI